MSIIKTSTSYRSATDHFEPEPSLDASDQRKLRGHLEQIDYAAYDADVRVLQKAIGDISVTRVRALAHSVARARAEWVQTALTLSAAGRAPTAEEVARLGERRTAFEELREAYEGVRRMIERGYLTYNPAAEVPQA